MPAPRCCANNSKNTWRRMTYMLTWVGMHEWPRQGLDQQPATHLGAARCRCALRVCLDTWPGIGLWVGVLGPVDLLVGVAKQPQSSDVPMQPEAWPDRGAGDLCLWPLTLGSPPGRLVPLVATANGF
jgi:hypothetical protein